MNGEWSFHKTVEKQSEQIGTILRNIVLGIIMLHVQMWLHFACFQAVYCKLILDLREGKTETKGGWRQENCATPSEPKGAVSRTLNKSVQ